jgi:hypothetical protein
MIIITNWTLKARNYTIDTFKRASDAATFYASTMYKNGKRIADQIKAG